MSCNLFLPKTGLSIGSSDSVPALVGFNAGDNETSAAVPQSNTDEIINITMTTNVDIPGVWMFQVDSNKVEGTNFSLSIKII